MEHVEAHTTKLLKTVSASEMKSSAVHFMPGDVLYGRLRPYLNKVISVDFEGLCSGEFIVLPSNGEINASYLKYFLNSADFVRFAASLNTGDRPRVDFGQIGEREVPLPPLDEQKEIVAAIETQFARLDDAVAALVRARTRLKRYRASVLKAACEGRLVFTEAELARQEGRPYEPASDLLARIKAARPAPTTKRKQPVGADGNLPTANQPPLPEGWAWATLGTLLARSEYGTSTKCNYEFAGPPVLRIPNIVRGKVDLNDLKFAAETHHLSDDHALQVGDMLMVRTNGSVGLIGRTAVIRTELPSKHWFASYLLRFRFIEQDVLPLWVSNYLWSDRARAWIERNAASSAGQHNVSLTLMSGADIPVPPLAEQERIVAEVERRLSVLDRMEAEVTANLKRAESLRQAILRNAFAGRLA